MKKKKESLKMSNKVKKIFKAYVLGVCIFALTCGSGKKYKFCHGKS